MKRGPWVPLSLLLLSLSAGPATASGGVVKFKTDNGPDGYFYNANGVARARYCAFYDRSELDPQAIICGMRIRDLDQSTITAGVDDYVLGGDLRAEDGNNLGYADIRASGLIALTDSASLGSCSTTGAPRTRTFGGGAGVPDPLTAWILTCPQPANNNPAEAIDFCGVLLDTTSLFVNSARTQAYSVVENPLFASIGFNHFVEAIVFEPRYIDLNMRMSGSSRFPGVQLGCGPGRPGCPPVTLKVAFARRPCDPQDSNCECESGDAPLDCSDDFITARATLDNNTASPAAVRVVIEADRSVINPKLGPKDVTRLFRPCGGGPGIMNPLTLPANSRTSLCLEVKIAIRRRFIGSFPVDVPFSIRLEDPNSFLGPPTILDSERQNLGLRPVTGYLDNDSHSGGFLFSRSPVATGDALGVLYYAVDLQNRSNTPTPYSVSGIQLVGGEFGASGLSGLDAVEFRPEDPIFPGKPDLSPSKLIRAVGTIGDPGNADGIPFGPPATTVNLDFTDFVVTPGDISLALDLFALAYLNPGDTAASVTAIGAASGGDTFVGQSTSILGNSFPVIPLTQDDLEIRLDVGSELGNPSNLGRSSKTKRLENAVLRRVGEYIPVDDAGQRLD